MKEEDKGREGMGGGLLGPGTVIPICGMEEDF